MNLEAIINAAADDADEFLAGTRSMTEARPAIRDYLKENHPNLSPMEAQQVTAGLLAILEEEGFFQGEVSEDSWDDATGRSEG